MSKRSTSARYGALAIGLVGLLVVALTGAAIAGSDDAKKGYLGVFMQELDEDVREGLDLKVKSGVLISGVEKGSPAEEAGVEDGDVIVEFDGKKVGDPDALRDLVADTEPGQEVRIKVVRNGKKKTLDVVVGEWPDDEDWFSIGDLRFDRGDWSHVDNIVQAFSPKPRLGVEVAELNDDLAPYFKTEAGGGVLVLKINEESVAEEAGIKSGDVIQKVGEEPVTTVEELRESLEDYEEGDEVPIVVLRKGKKNTLTATMDEPWGQFHWSGKPRQFYKFDTMPRMYKYHSKTPKIDIYSDDDDLREEIDDLKKELKELKKEVKELKKG
jgi:S1-C subfamily serine protease